jgi:putative endonuclease
MGLTGRKHAPEKGKGLRAPGLRQGYGWQCRAHSKTKNAFVKGYVYIMTNDSNKVLYTGVTSNLKDRLINHKIRKFKNSFTASYNLRKLVCYECFGSMVEAIKREKQIKGGSRQRKIDLINRNSPDWVDLSDQLKDG